VQLVSLVYRTFAAARQVFRAGLEALNPDPTFARAPRILNRLRQAASVLR